MELNFTQNRKIWVSEFEATGDFNLHIEGISNSKVKVYMTSVKNGRYAYVEGSTPTYGEVYDCDFSAVVYPKYIKVECATEPTMAVVTYNA